MGIFMRVESDLPGPRVSAVEAEPQALLPDYARHIGPEFLAPCSFMFLVHKGPETSIGYTEEACVTVLLEQLMMQLLYKPCDEFRRAYYHLVMAQEALKHHRAA